MAKYPTLVFQFDAQTLRVLEDDRELSVDLPYLLRQELLFKPEVAETFTQALAERLPEEVRPADVIVRLPIEWGSMLLELPLAGLSQIENPLSHLQWELDTNSPEDGLNYRFDYEESPERVRLTAIRRPVEEFLSRVVLGLGFRPAFFEVLDQRGRLWRYDPLRARQLEEALESEKWKNPSSLPWVLPVIAALVLGAWLVSGWVGQKMQTSPEDLAGSYQQLDPVEEPAVDRRTADETIPPVDSPALDRVEQSSPPQEAAETPATGDPAGEASAPLSRVQLLQALSAAESRLPGYLLLDGKGLLVDGSADMAELLAPIPLRALRSSGSYRWFRLEGLEDAPLETLDSKRTMVGDLSGLADTYSAPGRLLLIRTESGWSISSGF